MSSPRSSLTHKQQVELTAIQQNVIKAVGDNDMPRLLEMKDILFQWVADQIDQAVLTAVTPFISLTHRKTKN